jgi:hypothetical protein
MKIRSLYSLSKLTIKFKILEIITPVSCIGQELTFTSGKNHAG